MSPFPSSLSVRFLRACAAAANAHCRSLSLALALVVSLASLGDPAAAGSFCGGSLVWMPGADGGNLPGNCSGTFPPSRCYPPVVGTPSLSLAPGCDPNQGSCSATVTVPVTFPGNHQNDPAGAGFAYSFAVLAVEAEGQGLIGTCGFSGAAIDTDSGTVRWGTTVSCAGVSPAYTLAATSCPCPLGPPFCIFCPKSVEQPIDLSAALATICNPEPPPPPCKQCPSCPAGGTGGAPPESPTAPGKGGGSGAGADVSSGRLAVTPGGSGGGVTLRYLAGGAGHSSHPGNADWNVTLGRHWSHEGMERIVRDPDDGHVWLLTREGGFIAFTDSDPLDPQGLYESVAPSDETLVRLYRTVGGWELRHLEGLVQHFDGAGLWQRSVDRNGNATVATWSGSHLERIDLPDGRSETFSHDGSGRLIGLTLIGVDGTSTRTWAYTWSGLDLVRIGRPDGTAWELGYDDPRHPGWLTRLTLLGSDGTSRRIERAWEYDARGRMTRTWKGTASALDPQAVDRWEYRYEDPSPGRTTVVDPLGNASIYTFDADPTSPRTRVLSLSGDCPTCGSGPSTQYQYDDPAHPLRPTLITDGLGRRTLLTYDPNGSVTSRVDALGTPEERSSFWLYQDPDFPAFPTGIERPSTSGQPADSRASLFVYDERGNLAARQIEGIEAGSFFSYETVLTYTAEGQVATIDPAGHGTDDVTAWSYDPSRGGLLPATRTDPVIGAHASSGFEYDAFNRERSTTDPNGLVSTTEYDPLDRVVRITQEGATPGEDLVTESRYTVFGDLFQTVLPEGNVIEYGYDLAGRLISIERKPDGAPGSHGERVLFTLDAVGHRIEERHEVWDGGWLTRSRTTYLYTTRCHLDRVTTGAGTNHESTTEYSYDCAGNLAHLWDPNHPTTGPPSQSYGYDALDRLRSLTQPGAIVTRYEYDVQDHLVAVIDAEGSRTEYVYSDRDLLTRETSPVSGVTTHGYDQHGQLLETADARGITTTRTVDPLDRVLRVEYTGGTEPREYVYDEGPFALGRLSEGRSEADVHLYLYDRFGRLVRDGELGYAHDRNSRRARVEYPGAVAALYGYDFADRERTLSLEMPDDSSVPIVVSVEYEPSGPLRRLELGNGLIEQRDHDTRYFPDRIRLQEAGQPAILDWDYTVDSSGNIIEISDPVFGERTYSYDPQQFFLTAGNGPWGERSWTYDRIGNRLSQTREAGLPMTYIYEPNGAAGNTAILDRFDQGGPFADYSYDATGNLVQVERGGNVVELAYDGAARLVRGERQSVDPVNFVYDHRDFLRRVRVGGEPIFADGFESGDSSCWSEEVPGLGPNAACGSVEAAPLEVTYDSSGVLHALERRESLVAAGNLELVLYFAGRPVVLLDLVDGTIPSEVRFVTTDHLATPAALTDASGAQLWQGGLEPFGQDWSGAEAARMFLRFSGQWVDEAWGEALAGVDVNYNVHRWYETATGRYSRPDPFGMREGPDVYAYSNSDPINKFDPLGLAVHACSRRTQLTVGPYGPFGNHAYFWDDRPTTPPNKRFCGRGRTTYERGPRSPRNQTADYCNVVPGSQGQEDEIMKCCLQKKADTGFWFPPFNDCATLLEECLSELGFVTPGPPGGRTGPPCDTCEPGPDPMLP